MHKLKQGSESNNVHSSSKTTKQRICVAAALLAIMAAVLLFLFFLLTAAAPVISQGTNINVTYDGRSLIINGERKMLFSGSIHYPRSTPAMWPSLLDKAKEGGIDVIDTYVFWNLHEPQQGQYDFSGGRDIIGFLKLIQAKGLYVMLRIGPFIEAEWTYGGLPFWLHDVPGITFRSDNEPFKYYMQRWVTLVVNMMKYHNLFASQGGPIILSQIENEYQRIEGVFPNGSGSRYVQWAANMAVGLDTGVPWVTCSQQDAPDPVINSCNGYECGRTFKGPNSPNKPALWTENWTGFLQRYGEEPFIRTEKEIAYNVALFIAAKSGSFVNYYMYHGGTNFGRTAATWIITSYYDQAPLDEYGLVRQPLWSHLKEMHSAIKSCSKPLLEGEHTISLLGEKKEAHIFTTYAGECAAFLVNKDNTSDASVVFQGSTYDIPALSISILADCKNVVFNTAEVNTQSNTRSITPVLMFDKTTIWEAWNDGIPTIEGTSLKTGSLLDHMTTTKDTTDYLWHTSSFESDSDTQATLSVRSNTHVVHAFVNGAYVGNEHGGGGRNFFTLDTTANLTRGTNDISLLSVMVGYQASGPYLERQTAGLRSVNIQDKDLTTQSWGYQVGLLGEQLQVFTEQGLNEVQWSSIQDSYQPRLTWYKARFDAPCGDGPLALNLGSMGKGQVWVNGQSIGRYWVSMKTAEQKPSQTWYNVPRSFLNPTGNLLVLLEEEYGDPLRITLDSVIVTP